MFKCLVASLLLKRFVNFHDLTLAFVWLIVRSFRLIKLDSLTVSPVKWSGFFLLLVYKLLQGKISWRRTNIILFLALARGENLSMKTNLLYVLYLLNLEFKCKIIYKEINIDTHNHQCRNLLFYKIL